MINRPNLRGRFWIQVVLATATAALTVAALVSREWIEVLFHIDPDAGSGVLEWATVIVLATATLLSSLFARAEWRQAATASSISDIKGA